MATRRSRMSSYTASCLPHMNESLAKSLLLVSLVIANIGIFLCVCLTLRQVGDSLSTANYSALRMSKMSHSSNKYAEYLQAAIQSTGNQVWKATVAKVMGRKRRKKKKSTRRRL